MKPLILFGILFLLCYPQMGCIKNCKGPTGGYLFILPHTVSPAKPVYKVGDTISISADFPHDVLEYNEGNTFLLEDFSFSLIFGLFDLNDSVSVSRVRAFNTCEIILEEDTNLSLDDIGPLGEYTYQDGRYRLGFKFRPLKPGFYALVQKSLTYSSSIGNDAVFPGRCDKRGPVRAFVDVNEGAENNYHLLEDPHYLGATFPWRSSQKYFYWGGVFLFYVEE